MTCFPSRADTNFGLLFRSSSNESRTRITTFAKLFPNPLKDGTIFKRKRWVPTPLAVLMTYQFSKLTPLPTLGTFPLAEAEGIEPTSRFIDILVFKTSSSSIRTTSIRTLEGGRTLIFIHYHSLVSKTRWIQEQKKTSNFFKSEVSSIDITLSSSDFRITTTTR